MAPCALLLPQGIEYSKWAVVACDQYTSDRAYWQRVEQYVHGAPSTLQMIFPEAYLADGDADIRIAHIHRTMRDYQKQGLFRVLPEGVMYVERTCQAGGPPRRGLVMAVDLEAYDYRVGARSLVRATEGTIAARIPPRLRIRKGATLETSHVLLLIDDPAHLVIEPLALRKDDMQLCYDFDLMMGGGHIAGWHLAGEEKLDALADAMIHAFDPVAYQKRTGIIASDNRLTFAVGDGNHSLATAKACWEQIKQGMGKNINWEHPARYAMVEIVNVHDEALTFAPIHRAVFGVRGEELSRALAKEARAHDMTYTQLPEGAPAPHGAQVVEASFEGWRTRIALGNPTSFLAVGTLQDLLDAVLPRFEGAHIDYIHGDETARKLASQPLVSSFLLPAMDKADLFRTVLRDGALPRKTFSMGEADEKRYYLEARPIER